MANIIESDLKITGNLILGNSTNPPNNSAGAGVMDATNKPNGSIHLRTDANQNIEVLHNSVVREMGLADGAIEMRLANLVANTANQYITYIPKNCRIVGVKRRYTTVPASAAGTVLDSLTVAGRQILASAAENEEGLTNDTIATHNLTATTADLNCTAMEKVILTITSNNADMTGGTVPMYYILTKDN